MTDTVALTMTNADIRSARRSRNRPAYRGLIARRCEEEGVRADELWDRIRADPAAGRTYPGYRTQFRRMVYEQLTGREWRPYRWFR